MIQILQNYCTDENVGILTEKYHVDCVEYLPSAKEKPYESGQIFLTLRLDRSLPEVEQIIESNSFMRILASANQILNGFKGCVLKSISYPFDMEENKEKLFMVVTATVEKDSLFQEIELAELGELLEADLIHHQKPPKKKPFKATQIEPEEKKEFKFADTPAPKQETKPQEVPVEKVPKTEEAASDNSVDTFDDMFDNDDDFMESQISNQHEESKVQATPDPEPEPEFESESLKESDMSNDFLDTDLTDDTEMLETSDTLKVEKNVNVENDHSQEELFNSNPVSFTNDDFIAANVSNFTERFSSANSFASMFETPDNSLAADTEMSLAELLAPVNKQFEEEQQAEQKRLEQEQVEAEKKRVEQEKVAQKKAEQEKQKIKEKSTENSSKSVQSKASDSSKSEKDNSKTSSKNKQNTHIAKIPDKIKHTVTKQPKTQIEAYNAATADIPFLNMIDEYVPTSDIDSLSGETPLYEIHEDDYYQQLISSRQTFYRNFTKIIKEMTGLEHLALEKALRDPSMEESLLDDIERFIAKHIQISENDKTIMMDKIKNALLSYYVLTNAINNPEVSDIRVLSYDNISVKIHGDHYKADGLSFIDEEDYNMFINRIIIRHRLTVNYPILVFTDKDFHPDYILRFNLCLGMLNSSVTPYLHIRKVPKEKTTLDKLKTQGMLDDKIANYLLDKVTTSRGIVFSGPSASGKTTLMNALVDYIPKSESVLCIQESEELFSNVHPDAYFQHVIKDRYGKTVIGLSELGQNGLLCDSAYFIIGEVKGGEARDLLRASNTGHKCWCSVHSQSSQETIPRLADYVKYGSDYSLTEATRMLKDLEVIVYIQGYRVVEISEIVGYDEEKGKILYKSIYRKNYQPTSPETIIDVEAEEK